MQTEAAASCPADKSHLVPWLGGRWFLSGANVAWQNGGFGADFGTVEAWGQHTYSSADTERMFADLHAAGANSMRWWVFADGRAAPEFAGSPGGAVTGFDANTLPSMADAIKLAAKYDIYLTFTLWSFDMLANGSDHAGLHRDLIVDGAKRQSYLSNALIPMLQYPVPGTSYTIGTHPNVLSWEVINEPEWGITESGSLHENIPAGVSLAEMQRFIAETAGTIHRHSNQLVTVGAAAMKWNSSTAPGSVGNWYSDAALQQFDPQGQLDYYQVHYYAWTNGDGVNWTFSPMKVTWQQGGFDKPVVVGEYPANASGSGMSLPEMLESMYGNCYAGAWGWTYEPIDDNGTWADMVGPITQFDAAHADEVTIRSGGTTPPPVTSTPQPPTATPVDPNPPSPTTPVPTAPPAVPAEVELLVYGDALEPGWEDWSWDAEVNPNESGMVQSGSRSIATTYGAAWAAMRLHASAPISTSGYDKLSFWIHGGSTGGQPIQFYLQDGLSGGARVELAPLQANAWKLVEVPLSQLGNPAQINDIIWQDVGGSAQPTYYVDQISLGSSLAAPTPEPPTATPEPPTATPEPPTATPEPPTATPVDPYPAPPTATPVDPYPAPPTVTPEPPTVTPEPPTVTPEPPTVTPEPPATAGQVIYDDALASGWTSKAIGATVVLTSDKVAHDGSRSIAVTSKRKESAFWIRSRQPVLTTGAAKLSFWVHGGDTGGQALELYTRGARGMVSQRIALPTPVAGAWSLVEVPLSQLGNPATIRDIAIRVSSPQPGQTFYLDQIALVP